MNNRYLIFSYAVIFLSEKWDSLMASCVLAASFAVTKCRLWMWQQDLFSSYVFEIFLINPVSSALFTYYPGEKLGAKTALLSEGQFETRITLLWFFLQF